MEFFWRIYRGSVIQEEISDEKRQNSQSSQRFPNEIDDR